MNRLTVKYKNLDGSYRLDDAVRTAMSKWPREEVEAGQDPATDVRHMTFDFTDDQDSSVAIVDLEAILQERFGGELAATHQYAESCPGHSVVLIARPKTAQDVFYGYSDRLGWGLSEQADILLNWFGEAMIEPLLQYIQDGGLVEDLEEFLANSFDEDVNRAVASLSAATEHP